MIKSGMNSVKKSACLFRRNIFNPTLVSIHVVYIAIEFTCVSIRAGRGR
jgi:hypothetical protein